MTRRVSVRHGDALALSVEDCSIDAIVTDPPYGLEFMANGWDRFAAGAWYQDWCEEWATEALRVLKPGGHLLAFGGTRTYHRLVCGIEDAGFDIRDSLTWMYGSGFPKSLDVSKAIDKAAGAEREVMGERMYADGKPRGGNRQPSTFVYRTTLLRDVTAPSTVEAHRWQGWGTALKPGHEPIVVARKPFQGTVAGNVLAHRTGALNIDGCRVIGSAQGGIWGGRQDSSIGYQGTNVTGYRTTPHDLGDGKVGRWPSNVVLSHSPLVDAGGEVVGDACSDGCVPGCPVAALDVQSGASVSHATSRGERHGVIYGGGKGPTGPDTVRGHGDAGGASRFFPVFRYEAKAPAHERPRVDGVAHPTVKPLGLMRWLCRLVTPPDGLILDQFAGSGATVEASIMEGFRIIAMDNHKPYLPLIRARVARARAAK